MASKVISIPIAFGIILRLFLMFFIKELDFIQISSPVSRFKSIKEGIYYYYHGLNPYEGVFKESPLILLLFSAVQNHYLQALIFIACDYLAAISITKIAEWRKSRPLEAWLEATIIESDDQATMVGEVDEEEDEACLPKQMLNQSWKSPSEEESVVSKCDPTVPIDIPFSSSDIGSLYLLNPFSVIACVAKSTQIFSNLSMVLALYYGLTGSRRASMLALSVGTALTIYPMLLVGPCVLLLADFNEKLKIKEALNTTIIKSIFGLLLYTTGWITLSFLLMGNWKFIDAVYGSVIFCTDLKPNIGLFWYFYIEVFDQFRTFFLTVFHLNVFIFIIPLCLKFRKEPLLVAMMVCASITLFKTYPTLADPPVYMALLSMHYELFKWSPHMFLALSGIIYSSCLAPMMYNAWVWQGSGNANFFYAITLVWAISHTILVVDVVFAYLKREWERLHPGWRRVRPELLYQYTETD